MRRRERLRAMLIGGLGGGSQPSRGPTFRVSIAPLTFGVVATATMLGTWAPSIDPLTFGGTIDVDDTPPPPEASLTVVPASWDDRDRAYREGDGGSNYALAYAILPSDFYLWWRHDRGDGVLVGQDPGTIVAELAGLTAITVDLPAGNSTAAAVATLTRAAITGSGLTAGGTGADVTASGAGITGDAPTFGEPAATRATRRWWGSRWASSSNVGGGLDGSVAQRFVSPSNSQLVDAIGVYVVDAASDVVSLALYTGGATNSLTGTTLVLEATMVVSGTGWRWCELTAAQAAIVASSTSCWWCCKGEAAAARLASVSAGVDGASHDFDAASALYIFTNGTGGTQIDQDPLVAWPASLAAIDVSGNFSVLIMGAVRFRPADEGTDASWILPLGVHTAAIFGGSESALTIPDAGGATVSVQMDAPDVLGLEVLDLQLAVGATHASQFRAYVREGGAFEDQDGATLLWDGGQTTGSATDAWVVRTAPTGGSAVAVTAGSSLWACFKGTGGVTIRYAPFATPDFAGEPWNPPDYTIGTAIGNGAEYESNTANPNHSTNPAVAPEATYVAHVSDVLPGNGPGILLRLRVPGLVA